jgi:hypothetical protein
MSLGVAGESIVRENISSLARSRKKIESSESIQRSINLLCRLGSCGMCFITRCCIRWYPISRCQAAAGGYTPKSSVVASASFQVICVPAAGKRKTSAAFCDSPHFSVSGTRRSLERPLNGDSLPRRQASESGSRRLVEESVSAAHHLSSSLFRTYKMKRSANDSGV